MNETEEVEQTEIPEETQEPTPENPETPEESQTPETPSKKPMNPKVLGGIAITTLVVVGLCVSLFSGGTTAKDMRLEKYSGSVTLHNKQEEKEVLEGARLMSQDNLETFSDSSAYIVLDDVKVLKADEETHMEVVKVNEDLDIELYKGSLYFSVTEPLTDSETLEFHTNNVVTGVRGTSGVITYTDDSLQSQVVVLSGTVEVVTMEDEPETVLVNQGEIAIATTQEDGTVELEVKEQEKTPVYGFSANFLDDSGENVAEFIEGEWKEPYREHLANLVSNYSQVDEFASLVNQEVIYSDPPVLENTHYALHDMDSDGIPELILNFVRPSKGLVMNEYNIRQMVETEHIVVFGQFADGYQAHDCGGNAYFTNESGRYGDNYLAVPVDGDGFYYQQTYLDKEFASDFTISHWDKEATELVQTSYTDGQNKDFFGEGSSIRNFTWTHYTDLSGLEWNV